MHGHGRYRRRFISQQWHDVEYFVELQRDCCFDELLREYLKVYFDLRDQWLEERLCALRHRPQWTAEALVVYRHFRRYAAELESKSWEFIAKRTVSGPPQVSGEGFEIWVSGCWEQLDPDPHS